MLQSQIHWIVVVIGMFVLGEGTFNFADEKKFEANSNDPFYSLEFPKERMGFWGSVSQSFVHLKFKDTLKKLEAIDEFSDDSGLSLLEFCNIIAIKHISMSFCDDQEKTNLIEYLDRIVSYTRKSSRWSKETFVLGYLFSLL